MVPTLTELLDQISKQASRFREPVLAHICRMAALEAQGKDIPVPRTGMTIIGMWDWDAVNDVNHLDEGCAELFGVDPVQARLGCRSTITSRRFTPTTYSAWWMQS